MLQSLRKSTSSWIMKAILGLLALTFVAFFGVGRGPGGHSGRGNVNAVVQVGGVDIGAQEISRAFNQEIRAVAPLIGGQLDAERARQIGLLDSAVRRLVAQTLLRLAADDLGVVVSDELVRREIIELPQFQDEEGRFNRAAFEAFLLHSGTSEGELIEQLRSDLSRGQYAGTLSSGGVAPFTLVETLYRYREERRVAEAVIVPAATDVGEPNEAALAAYYEDNKERFRAPEYRAFTLASLTPEQLAAEIAISEEDIAAEYELRQHEFRIPEQRELDQAVFPDREAADRTAMLVAEGTGFVDAVEEVSGAAPVPLGRVVAGELLPELAEPAFSASKGDVVGPIESPLGWHLLRVNAVSDGEVLSLDDVRDELSASLALEEARDGIFDVIAAVEDTLAGGGTLEEATDVGKLSMVRVEAMDRQGLDPSGQPIPELDIGGDVAGTAFETEEAQDSFVVETSDGGFFVLRVDRVNPERIRSRDEAREAVTAAWRESEGLRVAERQALEIVERVNGGASFADAARELGHVATTSEPFSRTESDGVVPGPLVELLFQSDVGDVVFAPTPGGFAVGRLLEVTPPTGSVGLINLRDTLNQAIAQDIQSQLVLALQDRYEVEVDEEALDNLFSR
ncbi:MAG: SurA N-terminal domain-containing protein [Alphaproteobacteria bacterium]